MTISAKIIADSVSPEGIRITTMQLRYPRFIHAEFMTHRVFSRNASSSRAIPVERLIQDVIDDTAMPVKWFKNKPGMQGTEELVGTERDEMIRNWIDGRNNAVERARGIAAWGAHKQHVNRLLEPFSHINVVVTATEWSNFFALRDHPDAQPEIMVLAQQMKLAMEQSTPQYLKPGQWHLPYVTDDERKMFRHFPIEDDERQNSMTQISVARCARVSYLTHQGKKPDFTDDMRLYERLLASTPLHASPAEHQATPDTGGVMVDASGGPTARKPYFHWDNFAKHGNFRGWIQFRKTLPNESQ